MTDLRDGLYWVTTRDICAGFVIRGGRVTMCAPILRSRLRWAMSVAVPIRLDPDPTLVLKTL